MLLKQGYDPGEGIQGRQGVDIVVTLSINQAAADSPVCGPTPPRQMLCFAKLLLDDMNILESLVAWL